MSKFRLYLLAAAVLALLPFPGRLLAGDAAAQRHALPQTTLPAERPLEERVLGLEIKLDLILRRLDQMARKKSTTKKQPARKNIVVLPARRKDCGCNGHGDCTCRPGRCNCEGCHPSRRVVPAKPKQVSSLPRLPPIDMNICPT